MPRNGPVARNGGEVEMISNYGLFAPRKKCFAITILISATERGRKTTTNNKEAKKKPLAKKGRKEKKCLFSL